MNIKKTLKHWPIPKTHLKPHWSTKFDQVKWSLNQLQSLTKDWPNLIDFDEVSQYLTTLFSQSDCLVVIVLHKHKYLIVFYQSNGQILDLSLLHDGHVSLYSPTKKLWLTLFTQSNHLIKFKFKTNILPHSFNIMVKLWI